MNVIHLKSCTYLKSAAQTLCKGPNARTNQALQSLKLATSRTLSCHLPNVRSTGNINTVLDRAPPNYSYPLSVVAKLKPYEDLTMTAIEAERYMRENMTLTAHEGLVMKDSAQMYT